MMVRFLFTAKYLHLQHASTKKQTIMRKKHQFHRENCANTIRETFKDMFDRTIVLAGKHAFEWSIMVCDHGVVTRVTFSCREDARREYTRLKKLK